MKSWEPNHPKAKLMARKRHAILAAAHEVFLRQGYGGASMETIAQAAGVSIMTLYRHSESKADLFEAIISLASSQDPQGEPAIADRTDQPLREALVTAGVLHQTRLAHPDNLALMRAVLSEVARFPDLAHAAYRGHVGEVENTVDAILTQAEESRGLSPVQRRRLTLAFVDALVGSDTLRRLLGLEGLSPAAERARAEQAAAALIVELAAR